MTTEAGIGMNSIVMHNQEIIHSGMDQETVMVNLERGQYYGLNPAGSAIWAQLAHPLPVADLCRRLQNEYNVPEEQCQREVLAYLQELYEEGLICLCPAG